MTEEWKTIPGTSDLYQASTLGRIRSTDRVIVKLNRWGYMGELRKRGRVLKPWLDSNGYEVIYIAIDKGRDARNVHRLIAETYLEGSGNGLDVNHKDGVKTNNRPENLEWCTRKENMAHALAAGLIKRAKPISGIPIHGGKKVVYGSAGVAALALGKTLKEGPNIWRAANGKARQAYGYYWRYETP